MASVKQWSVGYARQAEVDFQTFQRIQASSIPSCHKLQFLQMACEKLVKSHLCGEGIDPRSLQTSHAYVAKYLPIVLREQPLFKTYGVGKAKEVTTHARHLAREIDVLAPAVKRGGLRPDNCEYPWEDAGGVLRVPVDWTFHPSRLMEAPAGRTILKLIRGAIDRLVI